MSFTPLTTSLYHQVGDDCASTSETTLRSTKQRLYLSHHGTIIIFLKTGSPVLPDVCELLDFRRPSQFPYRTDGFFHRQLPAITEASTSVVLQEHEQHRQLQFEGERCQTNVLDTARELPSLSTFVTLIETAGLEDIFLCAGPFTALIPSNEAFEALDPDLVEFLLDPANAEILQEVLLYHILPNLYLSPTLVPGEVPTLQGETVTVSLDPIVFNQASVLMPDIPACNGAIHVVGDVLIPPSLGM